MSRNFVWCTAGAVVAYTLVTACTPQNPQPVAANPSVGKQVGKAATAPTVVQAPTVTSYNGLLYAEMGPLNDVLAKKGAKVRVLWHDEQDYDTSCPQFIIGHSMGGNAAIRQAEKCQAAGKAPKAIVVIDAGRAPLTSSVPSTAKYACVSYYNPTHPIGGQDISGKCKNYVVNGYDHLNMPSAPAVVKGTLLTIFGK